MPILRTCKIVEGLATTRMGKAWPHAQKTFFISTRSRVSRLDWMRQPTASLT
jgi:hypothetical protein